MNGKSTGLLSYAGASAWLMFSLLTFIIFSSLIKVSNDHFLKYLRIVYTMLTLSISYYFIDKNAYDSKFDAIMCAINNSLITYSIFVAIEHFKLLDLCTGASDINKNIPKFVMLLTLFITQSIVTNKNENSDYNILLMVILLGCNILFIEYV